MLYLLITIHVIVCLFLIGVVLLQQGKSADLAGAFGGQGSQTAFGPRGAANLLTKLTTWGAIIFMLLSISLTVMLSRTSGANTPSSPAPPPSKPPPRSSLRFAFLRSAQAASLRTFFSRDPLNRRQAEPP